jgi:hypothetical protein
MPSLFFSPYALPLVLLLASNLFMTTAWYWRLRFKEVPLWQVVLISWGLAFIEYCLAVPANRWGATVCHAPGMNCSRPAARGGRGDERHQSSDADHRQSQESGEGHAAAGLVH